MAWGVTFEIGDVAPAIMPEFTGSRPTEGRLAGVLPPHGPQPDRRTLHGRGRRPGRSGWLSAIAAQVSWLRLARAVQCKVAAVGPQKAATRGVVTGRCPHAGRTRQASWVAFKGGQRGCLGGVALAQLQQTRPGHPRCQSGS